MRHNSAIALPPAVPQPSRTRTATSNDSEWRPILFLAGPFASPSQKTMPKGNTQRTILRSLIAFISGMTVIGFRVRKEKKSLTFRDSYQSRRE